MSGAIFPLFPPYLHVVYTDIFTFFLFLYLFLSQAEKFLPIPMATRSKAWVCGRLLAGIAGSNSIGDIDVSLL
jgi:hypothetical protein